METLNLAYGVTATFLARGGWLVVVYVIASGVYLAARERREERAYRHNNR
jgi:hypothetical protein